MEKKVIQLNDDVSDDFLSILEEAEAEALSAARSKRQKASLSAAAGDSHQEAPEGPYMAALRGSRSTLWQQQQQKQQHPRKQEHRPWQKKDDIINLSTADKLSASDTGACFKCGVSGHWARDCTAGGGRQGEGGGGVGAEGDVPEKACPCGLGSCLVLTSNTAKNPGRKFYRCPLRPENGGCNFFEWCDSPSSGTSAPISASNYQSNPPVPDLPCPCGAGSCLVLITKTGKNVGQQYYRCPANEGRGSCGFFKWCNERNSTANQPTFTSQYNPNSQYSGERNVSSCFKRGQEGHWARDCTKLSSDHSADGGMNRGAASGSGTCFKCGKSGHWARDCPTQDSRADSGSRKASDTFSSRFR